MEVTKRTRTATTATATIMFLSLTLLLTATATEEATVKLKISADRVDEPMRAAMAKRSIPTDTISTRFFYNPPPGDAPPPDVLQMLEHGQTYGNHGAFSSRSFVVASNTVPVSKPYDTPSKIQADGTYSGVPELFQGSGVGIRVRGSQNKVVQNDTAGILNLEVSDLLDKTSSTEDSDGKKTEPNTDSLEQMGSSNSSQDFNSIDLSTMPNSDTEVPVEFTTNSEFLNVEETTTLLTVSESLEDLPDSDTETATIRENIGNREIPEEKELAPTENTSELMTQDEDDNDKTTIRSMAENSQPYTEEEVETALPYVDVDSQHDLRPEKETTVPPLADESQPDTADYDEGITVHSVADEVQQILTEAEEKTVPSLVDDWQRNTTEEEEEEAKKYSTMELLKTNYLYEYPNNSNETPDTEFVESVKTLNDSEKKMTNNVSQEKEALEKLQELTGGNINTIFFTVEDEKDGQLRVKVGKALNYATNKNTIQKQGKYKENVYQYHFQDPHTGWYKFGYGGDNQWRHEERRGDGVVLGRYGWHDANGQEHATHFVADARGYRVVQPGQEIIMHVPAPTSPPKIQTVNRTPITLTTVQPFFTRKPTVTSDSSTTSTFPVASLSTTVTFGSQSLPTGPPKRPLPDQPSPVPSAESYPGNLGDLVSPPPDPYVVTGRPPIAYPLPHQSVSHRPGSWVYVTPTPQYQESSRPPSRPPYRPFRPYPHDRPIKSPFRPVNRPRPKPLRPRPLKPLQPNAYTGSRPNDDSEEDDDSLEEATGNLPVKGQGVVNSTITASTDLIGAIQTLLNNPLKYPLNHASHSQSMDENYIPNYPIPSNIPGGSQTGMDNEPSASQNPSSLSSDELLHFINLINSLKVQGQATGASSNRPAWSLSPWASSTIKIPPGHFPASGPSLPASVLRPPPSKFSSSPTTVHDIFHANQHHPQYPLDYAFMDEDYILPDQSPPLHSVGVQIKPAGSNSVNENTPVIKPGPTPGSSFLTRVPARPTATNSVEPSLDDNPSSSDYIGSVVWKLPVLGPLEVETPQNSETQDVETDNGISITVDKPGMDPSAPSNIEENKPQSNKDSGINSTSISPPSSTSSSISSVLTSTVSPSTTTATSEAPEPPATDYVWPYITTQPTNVITSTTNQTTTDLPPPPPPQNFWTELLKRIYYWPMMGKERRPTLQ